MAINVSQELLNETIRKLASAVLDEENQDEIEEILDTLARVYSDGFRHTYSEFFPLISELAEVHDTEVHDLNYLLINLEIIRVYAENDPQERGYDKINQNLFKLCDHLNLEISRFHYYKSNERRIDTESGRIEMLMQNVQKLETDMESASEKVGRTYSEIVAILGIFAAIIIAFFGGMNFIFSAVTSINSTHIYKVTVVVVVSGMILFNTICMLVGLIARLMGRNAWASCKTENCTCTNRCNSINRIKKRIVFCKMEM